MNPDGRRKARITPSSSPWYHIGMDFIGPISQPSEAGNRYILTISDYFTTYAWAKAMLSKEAAGVVSAMREVIYILAFLCLDIFVVLFCLIIFTAVSLDGATICYH